MKVRQLIERKGSNSTFTAKPEQTIGDAAKRLSELRIGCLIVEDSAGGMAGILSERDIVSALGRDGPACLSNAVSSIMTQEVVTCGLDDDENSILTRMSAGRFRHMPVMDDGKIAGLLSIGDVVKARIETLERDNEAMESMIRSATA